MKTNSSQPTPFLKWAGGKRQLLPYIMEVLPENLKELHYHEPFIGAGVLLFHLQKKNAIINDQNEELINAFRVVRDHPEALIADLKNHQNTAEYFYEIRQWDRTQDFKERSPVERASRVIYLNKTCFNGVYRVNKSGQFNSPFAYRTNPDIVNASTIRAVHTYLNENNVAIRSGDYSIIMDEAGENSFFYLDPPYHPLSETSNFTSYTQGGWGKQDQIRLKLACDELSQRGIPFLLSNSSSDFIRELYKGYDIKSVKANRSVNANGKGRGKVEEFLIKNY